MRKFANQKKMKKKYWYLLIVLGAIIIVIWRVNSVQNISTDNQFKSCPSAQYYGKITGLSDYGKILVYRPNSDKDGFPVIIDDKGNYSFELERYQYPLIEYFSFDNYKKSFPFVTKNCLKVKMDFEFYDTIINGNLVKDCRVSYMGDYKDVFDYLNYNDFDKEIFEPTFEKYSHLNEPSFSEYSEEIKSGEQLYRNRIMQIKDPSIHSVLVKMLSKDVNHALRCFDSLSEKPNPDCVEAESHDGNER